ASCRARNASRAAASSSPMPTIPAQDEFVLRELGHKRVDHAGQIAFNTAYGTLPLIGGAVLEYLGGDRELFRAPEPPCYRLKSTEKLIYLIAEWGGGPGLAGHNGRVEPVPGRAPLVVRDHPRRPG